MGQPKEEKPNKREEMNIIDQGGYKLVKRPRGLGQFMPVIFAVGSD